MARSILPNSDPIILQPIQGKHGVFQVKLLAGLNDHGLYYDTILLAIHNNGYSCHNLAQRILSVWDEVNPSQYAIEQYDYILACGGLTCSKETFQWIVDGCKEYKESE